MQIGKLEIEPREKMCKSSPRGIGTGIESYRNEERSRGLTLTVERLRSLPEYPRPTTLQDRLSRVSLSGLGKRTQVLGSRDWLL